MHLVYTISRIKFNELAEFSAYKDCWRCVGGRRGPITGALNSYLHAYHMYRADALRVPEIERLETLQRVFPYCVQSKNGTFRSWFCTEKPHSMTH